MDIPEDATVPEVADDAPPDGQTLPPHQPGCHGCGPDNACGHQLVCRREGDRVVAEHVFTEAFAGAPGLAHGGAVAAVVDDLLGHVLHLLRMPAVTRHLEVDYLKPVVLGETHDLVAYAAGASGRKVWLRCEARGEDDGLRFTADGLFIRVGYEHFLAGLPPEERARAEQRLEAERARRREATPEEGEEVWAW